MCLCACVYIILILDHVGAALLSIYTTIVCILGAVCVAQTIYGLRVPFRPHNLHDKWSLAAMLEIAD